MRADEAPATYDEFAPLMWAAKQTLSMRLLRVLILMRREALFREKVGSSA